MAQNTRCAFFVRKWGHSREDGSRQPNVFALSQKPPYVDFLKLISPNMTKVPGELGSWRRKDVQAAQDGEPAGAVIDRTIAELEALKARVGHLTGQFNLRMVATAGGFESASGDEEEL
jgi:hypothetical protein